MRIYAYPLASERKPASGRARLAAQGRKDGPERVNPISKKIRKGDLQENFFKNREIEKWDFQEKAFLKNRKKTFQEISEKPIFRTLGNRILICGRNHEERKSGNL